MKNYVLSKKKLCLQVTVCLCGRDTCNGPSLPPKDFLEDNDDIIDIEQVVREMNQVKEARPAPVAIGSGQTLPLPSVICLVALVRTAYETIASNLPNRYQWLT